MTLYEIIVVWNDDNIVVWLWTDVCRFKRGIGVSDTPAAVPPIKVSKASLSDLHDQSVCCFLGMEDRELKKISASGFYSFCWGVGFDPYIYGPVLKYLELHMPTGDGLFLLTLIVLNFSWLTLLFLFLSIRIFSLGGTGVRILDSIFARFCFCLI